MGHEKLAKSHGIFTNFVPEFDQICNFFLSLEKLSTRLESLHKMWRKLEHYSYPFHKMDREMVMENSGNFVCKVCGNPSCHISTSNSCCGPRPLHC